MFVELLPPANEVCEGYVFTGVCLSKRGGCLSHCMLGHTLWEQTLPGADTPQSRYPPVQCMLGDTGNKRAVSILLEGMLVVYGNKLLIEVKNIYLAHFTLTVLRNISVATGKMDIEGQHFLTSDVSCFFFRT